MKLKLVGLALCAALVVSSDEAGAQVTIPPCTPKWEAQHAPAYQGGTEARYYGKRTVLELASGRSGVTWETEKAYGEEGEITARPKLFAATYAVQLRGRTVRHGSLPETIRLPRRLGLYTVSATWAESAYVLEPLPPKPIDPGFGVTPQQMSAYWDALREYEDAEALQATILTPPCLRTAGVRVRVIRGTLPSVRVKEGAYGPESVAFVIKQRGPNATCETTRRGPIRLVVQGPDSRRVLRLSDTCGRWSAAQRGSGWVVRPWWTYSEFRPRAEAMFVARFRTPGLRDFSYRLVLNRRTLAHGKFQVVTRYR